MNNLDFQETPNYEAVDSALAGAKQNECGVLLVSAYEGRCHISAVVNSSHDVIRSADAIMTWIKNNMSKTDTIRAYHYLSRAYNDLANTADDIPQ